jgi:hypothetical protein
MTSVRHAPRAGAAASLLRDEPLVEFFQAALDRFTHAAAQALEYTYRIAQTVITLRFANAALVPLLTPALAHLRVDTNCAPDYTICLWDTVTTGVALPPPAWSWDEYAARGELHAGGSGRVRAAFVLAYRAFSIFDPAARTALFAIPDARELPLSEIGSPLLAIFYWIMQQQGIQLAHAAAVGMPQGGVLLVGKGGSGKSTAALACLGSALHYLADDYCLLAAEPAPYAYSLYNSGKLDDNSLRLLPHLAGSSANPERPPGEKALFYIYPQQAAQVADAFPLRALLLPRVAAHAGLTPASPMSALRALAPSTIFQLSWAGVDSFAALAALVKRLPCYYLDLDLDLSTIPAVIADLLHTPMASAAINNQQSTI